MKTYKGWKVNIRRVLAEELAEGNIEPDDYVWLDQGGIYYVDSGSFVGVDIDEMPEDMRELGTVAECLAPTPGQPEEPARLYKFKVAFRKEGLDHVATVEARNQHEAEALAGAVGDAFVFSVVVSE